MSYDMSIGDDEFNYTYNCSGMFYDCYPENGIRQHYGLNGKDAVIVLKRLKDHMKSNESRLREIEPSNGWGSFDGALMFVGELITASLNNPKEVWEGD